MKKLVLFPFLLFPFYSCYSQYVIYGTTGAGGVNNDGIIFKYNPATNKETVLFNFNRSNGFQPQSKLLYVSDSLLFGTTQAGGVNDEGVVYCFNLKTNIETIAVNYDTTNGELSHGDNQLIQAKDGLLYGTTWIGGTNNDGVLFSYNIQTHKDSIRCNFNDSTSLGNQGGPYMELWQDTSSGMLYGTSEGGGFPGGAGVIYGFNPVNNQLTRYYVGTLYGNLPWELTGGLTFANNGLLYGLSQAGGMYDSGSIYSFNITSHTVNVVYSFGGINGAYPNANELLLASNGLFYGGTFSGGTIYEEGVIFSFNPTNNIEEVLKVFNDTDGSYPTGRLIQDPANGLLYGVTYEGGDSNKGVLFSYDTSTRTYTKLLDFTGSNGAYPLTGLTLVDTNKSIDSGLAVSEVRTNNIQLRVYPNPANTMLNVEISLSNGEIAYFTMYNDIGEKIENIELSNTITTLSIVNLPSGVYYYRITDKNSNLITADKQMILH